MNKTRKDLAEYVSHSIDGYTLNQVKAMTDSLLEDMLLLAKEGRVVQMTNLGQLKQVTKKARLGRNPKTKEECIIPARKRLYLSFLPRLNAKEADE
jgi:nucleoid DNA-binding protein